MNHRYKLLFAAMAIASLALFVSVRQSSLAEDGIIYVDTNATGANNGTSWADAFTALQPALDAAVSGDQIWVADGTYKPSIAYGGIGDRYKSFQLKNGVALYGGFAGFETSLEERNWAINLTILSGDIGTVGYLEDNSYHVFYHPLELALNSSAIMDGFTITGGHANGSSPHFYGGGMLNVGASPTLSNLTFTGNWAYDGGGLYNWNGSAVTLTSCTFVGNVAEWAGGGMYTNSSAPVLTDCIFMNNSADQGGGISNVYYASPVVTNTIFWGNTADYGGGVYNIDNISLVMTNCTFAGNSAIYGGGMYSYIAVSAVLTNAILWSNTPDQVAGDPVMVTYSTVQGSYTGTGNMAYDPHFTDPANGDFHLRSGSPAIDAGTNVAPALPAFDFESDVRIMDGNGDGDFIVDMGVDEAPYTPYVPVVIYVDQEAAGANNGTTWADAFTTLQPALAYASSGDQIWVAAGTYKPSVAYGGTGDRYKSFQLKNGVALYGGFAGIESSLEARDWVTNLTILSGDLGIEGDISDNSYHVFYHPLGLALNSSAILDGFTITGGNANSEIYPHYDGGGMYNDSSSPEMTNCTFVGNSAVHGGGMSNSNSSPMLTNCTIVGNSASSDSMSSVGGGMQNIHSSPVLTSCIFSGNTAEYGGGMYNEDSSPTLTDSSFEGNSASWFGGGISNSSSSPVMNNCNFENNSAGYGGGGMYNYYSTPTLTNCIFAGNSANQHSGGGGVRNYFSSPVLINCTFTGNLASNAQGYGGGGGGIWNQGSSPIITNCILWGDTNEEIYNVDTESVPVVSYSDVQGGYDGVGNIDADPRFVDMANLDVHLRPDSPVIDAGNNAALFMPLYDFDGDVRILDGNGDGTAIVDMGADEAIYVAPIGLEVTIVVTPNTLNNTIRLTSRGTLPVAILTTADFDAVTVDPDTVLLAGAMSLLWEMEDVDRDGDLDLLLYFMILELVINPSTTEITLTAYTLDGTPIYGTDWVNIIYH